MSVDVRLREAFGETDGSWDEQVPTALAEITARHRREVVVRRAAVAVAGAAAAAAVVLAVIAPDDQRQSPAPEPSPTPSQGVGRPGNPLDGNWVSEWITQADVRRAARDAGDPGDTRTMLAGLPATPFRVVLVVNGDRSEIHTSVRSQGRDETVDQENIEVTGDRLLLTPQFADGENVHAWVVQDGVLRLQFVSTTEASDQGVPAEAWQRLFYDTAAFTHES